MDEDDRHTIRRLRARKEPDSSSVQRHCVPTMVEGHAPDAQSACGTSRSNARWSDPSRRYGPTFAHKVEGVPSAAYDDSWQDLPPFSRLYNCRTSPITPRMAFYLWQSAELERQVWVDDPDISSLPVVARTHATAEWINRFVECFTTVIARLATAAIADEGLPRCTGEEVALHLTIDAAQDFVHDRVLMLPPDFDKRIPACGNRDTDFDDARELLFADHDVLHLWDPALDGIENDAEHHRFVNIHPRDWFLPFSQ